jgi:hypothetical protein
MKWNIESSLLGKGGYGELFEQKRLRNVPPPELLVARIWHPDNKELLRVALALYDEATFNRIYPHFEARFREKITSKKFQNYSSKHVKLANFVRFALLWFRDNQDNFRASITAESNRAKNSPAAIYQILSVAFYNFIGQTSGYAGSNRVR